MRLLGNDSVVGQHLASLTTHSIPPEPLSMPLEAVGRVESLGSLGVSFMESAIGNESK